MSHGQTKHCLKDCIKKEKSMDKESTNMQMAPFMMENGAIT